MMRFSRLSLLSTKEGRAFEIEFSAAATVIAGKNGHGKSAIAKSLYQTLGAKPHKIDRRWQSASVSSLLEFSIGDDQLVALKTRDRFVILDRMSGSVLVDTTHLGSVLAPFLSERLDFGLLLNDKKDNLITPPPSYIFAPFYVDQDGGWQKPWTSFTDFYLSNSRQALTDFHMGRRTNAYYKALARREHQLRIIRKLEEERKPLAVAIEEISKLTADLAINLDVKSFEDEIDELAKRTGALNKKQSDYREKVNRLSNEKSLWVEQRAIMRLALSEMEKTVSLAAEQPDEVDCPTCGHSYENSIAARFGLISEYDDLFDALQEGEAKVRSIDDELERLRMDLGGIEIEIEHIDELLSVRKEDISLGDIISAQGRTETTGVIREKVKVLDALIGEAQAEASKAEADRKSEMNAKRSRQISDYFERRKGHFAEMLDAKIQEAESRLGSPRIGRGSEGVRELLAYYYAVLYCHREFSSSTFCPIVIDGANQQGQDKDHRKIIYEFLIKEKPAGAQLIFTAEEPDIALGDDYEVLNVGVAERQLMDESQYENVLERMRPFMDSLI